LVRVELRRGSAAGPDPGQLSDAAQTARIAARAASLHVMLQAAGEPVVAVIAERGPQIAVGLEADM
jgi:hypothetical protein